MVYRIDICDPLFFSRVIFHPGLEKIMIFFLNKNRIFFYLNQIFWNFFGKKIIWFKSLILINWFKSFQPCFHPITMVSKNIHADVMKISRIARAAKLRRRFRALGGIRRNNDATRRNATYPRPSCSCGFLRSAVGKICENRNQREKYPAYATHRETCAAGTVLAKVSKNLAGHRSENNFIWTIKIII